MLLTTLLFVLSISQALSQDDDNPCSVAAAQESCAACISTAKECGWCTAENYLEQNRRRCDTYDNHLRGPCEKAMIQYPYGEMKPINDSAVQDGATPADAVQIRPQSLRLRVRANKPVRIPIEFRMAANYPVDLYYLMDLSKSMEDDKENLARLGNLIADRMSAITKNFRLGFGSFVDKVVSPFVSIVPKYLKAPCTLQSGQDCVPPYGFQNQLSLDLETSKFAKKVRESSISGNLDAPEGGFDAIMQAIVCENEIGWRSVSRRMLVFSTDDGFHYAGDGKLGGIVKPNDGQCHMVNNIYSESSFQDYPSVSQISNKIKEKSVNVIFAVTADQFPVYEKLSQLIESSTTGILAGDSGNIVNLIQENYERIASKVKLSAESIDEDNIKVEFFSRCNGTEMKSTSECGNIKIGQTVNFEAEVTIKECPKDRRKWRQEFYIKPVGYQESLKIFLDIICECECEKYENEELNSPKCSDGNGTYVCGICQCNPGHYGKKCECKADGAVTQESIDQCIGPNSTRVCSNRGRCECGKCKCNGKDSNPAQLFSGPFCECDDFSCDRYKNELCGGPERGKCDCGVCSCNDGYNGTKCDCEKSTDKCMGASGEICGGKERGKCECNKCICEDKYSGATCEQCPSCPNECPKYEMCIECRVFGNAKFSDEECNKLCPVTIQDKKQIIETIGKEVCYFTDEEGCETKFSYDFDEETGKVIMFYKKPKKCPESVNVLAIVGGVVGGIVALGLLLLLIWKLLTFIYDSREFAKFEKERQNAKWDTGENPIYKQATSTFKNPTYGAR